MPLFSALNASLHIIAIILLSGSLCSENFLFRKGMTSADVRKLLIADLVHAGALLLILISGVIFLHSLDKDTCQALVHNRFFIAKITLFIVILISSFYPSLTFHRWRRAARAKRPSLISYSQRRWVSYCIHFELTALIIIPILLELAKAEIS